MFSFVFHSTQLWSYLQIVDHQRLVNSGVPNLSLTMYPFSIPTDEYVPLQHFNRLACTPSAFRQMNMYP